MIEIKYTIDVMHLNHPQTTPHFQSVEKLPSTKLVYKGAHSPSERQKPWSWGVWWGRKEGGLPPSLLRLCLLPSLAIDINSSDIKALYRRCQALEHLGKLDQAFKDVQRCATLEPQNQSFQETLRRLNTSIQEKVSWIRKVALPTSLGHLSQFLVGTS